MYLQNQLIVIQNDSIQKKINLLKRLFQKTLIPF